MAQRRNERSPGGEGEAVRGDLAALEGVLRRIDGRPYPAYRDLKGRWMLPENVEIVVDHVQGDPYAAPSRLRARVPTGLNTASLVPGTMDDDPHGLSDAQVAAEDWLLRQFLRAMRSQPGGSGRSGEVHVLRPGPEVVARSALRLRADGVAEVRLSAGLPAAGRRVLARQAFLLLTEAIVDALGALRSADLLPAVHAHVRSVRTQRQLRRALVSFGLVAFVADGAVLPRASGVDSRPLPCAVPFTSPPSLSVVLQTAGGPVRGMGIPAGVTLIIGGGYHGKSTLLHALESGHLDHIPGDGRQRVVVGPHAVKVRAEDGRRIASVDVSAFLSTLPGGRSTRPLDSDDASGSTSQAASIVEAIESGAQVLLFDEDTSATNLLVRDPRMRQLVSRAHEPITPLVERIRQLYEDASVSSILVVGGVGDALAVADRVLCMQDYAATDLTQEAHRVGGPRPAPPSPLPEALCRRVDRSSLAPGGKGRVRARDARVIDYGETEIEIGAVDQITGGAQAATLGHALRMASTGGRGGEAVPMSVLLDGVEDLLAEHGLDALSPHTSPIGSLVAIRRHELAACINRLRTTRVDCEPS